MTGSQNDHSAEDRCGPIFGSSRWTANGDEEPLRYVLPPALPGTEFIFAHRCSRRWRVFHESYVICLCLRASAQWFYQGRMQQPLSDSCFMLMEPGETHVNVQVPRPQTYVVLRIAPDLLAAAAAELGVRRTPHFGITLGKDPAIRHAFERLAACVEQEDDVLEQQSRFSFGVRLLLQHCIEQPSAAPPVRGKAPRAVIERCKTYIRERYHCSISLDEIAALSGLSRFHLLRSFQRAVGAPPHAYQIQLRIEHACRLLQAGVRPSMVASAVGFADQSHLTRHFRKIMFITPGAYRAARG
jgi:AraC-like DNA-binding protein